MDDDQNALLYQVLDSQTGHDIWTVSTGDVPTPSPVLVTAANEAAAQLSSDGKWLAYQSDESGEIEIYVRPFPGEGRPRQVSLDGGNRPRWRPDGRELFYLSPDGRLMSIAIATAMSGALEIDAPVPLFSIRLAYGTNTGLPVPNYAVAPGGQRFLMNVLTSELTSAPITVMFNWLPEVGSR